MGASSSTPEATLAEFYRAYGIKVNGGSEENLSDSSMKIGGLAEIEKFIIPPMSNVKKQLIKDIAHEMATKLAIPGLEPTGKTIDEIVEQLKKYVPDPRKEGNKKTWSEKAVNQKKAMLELANFINKRFGSEIINTSDNIENICNKIAELTYSLFTGTHSEFLTVKSDVERILKNINLLDQFLEQDYNVIIEKVNADKESTLSAETTKFQNIHRFTMDELRRQQTMLQNMLDVIIKPTDRDLEDALRNAKGLKSFIKKTKAELGTTAGGKKLSLAMSGFTAVAEAAKLVDNALQKLGISYKEYAKAKEPKDLTMLLSENTYKHLGSTTKELANYKKLQDVLIANEYQHQNIIDKLKESHGAAGAAEKTVKGGLKVDKVVKQAQQLRKGLLKSFNEILKSLFTRMLEAGKTIANINSGGKKEMDDKMENFIEALRDMPNIQEKYVFYSLSGYNDSIQSTERRESFISSARYLISTIDELLKDPNYAKIPQLKDMKTAFELMIKLMEDYVSKFSSMPDTIDVIKKRDKPVEGSEEFSKYIDKAKVVANAVGDGARKLAEVLGRDEDDKKVEESVEGGAPEMLPEITKLGYMFERIKDVLTYSFRIGKIRSNLAAFSGEIASYGEDYIKMLADAVAGSVDAVVTKKNEYLATGYETIATHPLNTLYTELVAATRENTPERDKAKEKFLQIQTFIVKLLDTKIEMYRTAEAVELYMKAFADGVSSNPDDIQSLLATLESTEIVSKWFTNKSGDFICQVFDTFPSAFIGNNAVYSHLNDVTEGNVSGAHYYLRVAGICKLGIIANFGNDPVAEKFLGGSATWNAWGAANHVTLADNAAAGANFGLPGYPYLGLPMISTELNNKYNAAQVVKYLERALGISVLKNLMAMFVNIGRKFGGKDLDKQTHMSGIMIYRNLMNYMTYGSLAFGTSDPATPAADTTAFDSDQMRHVPNDLINGDHNTFRTDSFSIGITGENDANAAPNPVERRRTYVTMRGIGHYYDAANPRAFSNVGDIFVEEPDLLFVMVIKSMVAKVLTTIGVYNLFHKPIQKAGLGYQSNLRMILGGADGIPKIIPEALELYIRLPLFAEFYREIFNFDDIGAGFKIISLVPELGGVFSGLVKLIFDRAKNIKNGEYSVTDVKTMIEEINKIYLRFKEGKNPINGAINAFIAEINRRYGVIKREERLRYLKEKSEVSKYEPTEELTDYELEGLDESDDYPRPAPSMSFQTVGGPTGNLPGQHKYKLDLLSDLSHVDQLRGAIDDLFRHARDKLGDPEDHPENEDTLRTEISFSSMIRARAEELGHAKTDKEKFDIVHTAINSLGMFAMNALEKSLIMFHETVVAPLNILHGTYLTLVNFEEKIKSLDDCLKSLKEWVKGSDTYWDAAGDGPKFIEGGYILFKHNTAVATYVDDDTSAKWNRDIRPFMNRFSDAGAYDLNIDQIDEGNIAIRDGTQGLEVGRRTTYTNLGGILDAANTTEEKAYAKEICERFVINQGVLFKTLFETIYSHASAFDKSVNVKVDVQKSMGSSQNAGPGTVRAGELCDIAMYVDHSKLYAEITNTFNHVKQSIDKFRGLLPKAIFDKYESYRKSDNLSENVGSLYWLEKKLINELVQGKRETAPGQIITLDVVNGYIKNTLQYLTRAWKVNGRDTSAGAIPAHIDRVYQLTPDGASEPNPDPTGVSFHEFNEVLDELIYYESFYVDEDFPNNGAYYTDLRRKSGPYPAAALVAADYGAAAPEQPNRSTNDLESLLFNNSAREKAGVAAGNPWPGIPITRYTPLYDPYDAAAHVYKPYIIYPDARRSIFIMFNRLVAAYVRQAFDFTTRKIYISTINTFANGAFSSAVMGDKNYDDSVVLPCNNILNFISTTGISYKGVLFKSLALTLRQLMTEMDDRTNKKQYLEAELAEIPLFIKERYKANFPVFEKLFTFLSKRCDLIKNMVRALNVGQSVSVTPIRAGVPVVRDIAGPDARVGNNPVGAPAVSRVNNERTLLAILDQVISGCASINQCIKNTLSELTDDPKYLETYQGSIALYENENGMMPFMPASSMTYYLKNFMINMTSPNDLNSPAPAAPIYDLGDPRFKLLYGTRKVLTKENIKLDDLPGMKDIVKQHNYSCESRHQIDDKFTEQFLQESIGLLRYLVDLKHYLTMFNSYKLGALVFDPNATALTYMATRGVASGYWANADEVVFSHAFKPLLGESGSSIPFMNSCYQLRDLRNMTTVLTDVINLTESAFQKEEKNKIVDTVQSVEGCPNRRDRRAMIAYNIIDKNVVPINLHALMREIPFIELMNYSYTFDHMVTELFGLKRVRKSNYITLDDITDPDARLNYRDRSPAKTLFGMLMVNPYALMDDNVYKFYLPAIIRGAMGVQGFGRPKFIGDEVWNKVCFNEIYEAPVYEEEAGPAVGHGHLKGKQEVLADLTRELNNTEYKTLIYQLVKESFRALNNHLIAGQQLIQTPTGDFDTDYPYDDINALVDAFITANGGRPNLRGEDLPALFNNFRDVAQDIDLGAGPGSVIIDAELFISILFLILNTITFPPFRTEVTDVIAGMIGNSPGSNNIDPGRKPGAIGFMALFTTIFQTLDGAIPHSVARGSAAYRIPARLFGMRGTPDAEVRQWYEDLFPVGGELPLNFSTLDNAVEFDAMVRTNFSQMNNALVNYSRKLFERLQSKTQEQLENDNPRYFPKALHYLEKVKGETEIREVPIELKRLLQFLGKERFDTNLIRNLFWITNIQRAIRKKLRQDLSWYDTRVVSDLSITSPSITESFGNRLNSKDFDQFDEPQ